LAYLINRGKDATKEWTPTHQFQEKQDDTADIIVVKNGFFNIIDVKTFNKALAGQPPNIISASKLANMCAIMLDTQRFDAHDITYVGVTWVESGDSLTCTDVAIRSLFKAPPETLYINWAAALQIQFHVEKLPQNYSGSVRDWCVGYLRSFVDSARRRAAKMDEEFVQPFLKYLK
jgi:type II restriction enzyme